MKSFNLLSAGLMAAAALLTACSDEDSGVSLTGNVVLHVPAGGFTTPRCRVLTVRPSAPEASDYRWRWTTGDSVLSDSAVLEFATLQAGTVPVHLAVADANGRAVADYDFDIRVTAEAVPYSPYVSRVTDYRPAPGQFVNELPLYEEGDTQADMNRKAGECLIGNARVLVTLGGYGGYVVCGFDHTILNLPGKADFKVLGNAFYANANPNPDAPREGGSCEPGIVEVAYDRNGNGLPDEDEWYELAGSEYHKTTTLKGYTITYRRPASDHQPVPAPENEQFWNTDNAYIAWHDSEGNEGYMPKNVYHSQDYYPRWITEETLSFTGTLLPDNAVDESGTGHYWVLYAYPWGYADNGLNTADTSDFDIAWAVDRQGRPVHLPGIDFVKIYTGVNQYCGWLGETSTEVMGVNDLHLITNP